MGKYAGAASTALGLLSSKGANITLKRVTRGAFDPVTQTEARTEATYTFRGIVMPPSKSADFDVGTLQNRNAVQLTLAQKNMPIEPKPGDTVVWKGYNWTIFWATTYDPAGDGAIYTVAYAER